jgi:hypothetical protein
MNHLEELVSEYFEWKDYFVKKNINVGKRTAGGYEMELDLIAYNPHENHLIHIETSLDAYSWQIREERYAKKFSIGRKYIFDEVFPWLDRNIVIDELIIGINKTQDGKLNGVNITTVDDYMSKIIKDVKDMGKAAKNAIPQKYPMLRTIQFCFCGYYTKPVY